MRNQIYFAIVLVFVILLMGIGLSLFFGGFLDFNRAPAVQAALPTAAPAKPAIPSGAVLPYNPPKPEDAPQDIREAVLLGQRILTDTQKVLPNYVGNQVNCTNCHFSAGLTQGGKNGGISLVGVSATYPKYRDRQKFAVDLVARVND